MDVLLSPSQLAGNVTVPASKSIMHRALICAALAKGRSVIRNTYLSQDILATIECLKKMGAAFQIQDGMITVDGLAKPPEEASFDCCESGSTIRFMIPVAAALGIHSSFHGKGKLVSRPLGLYQQAFAEKGIDFQYDGLLPAQLSGQLLPGSYQLKGNVSSQFITGLLFALPLLEGDSIIQVLPPFESKSYVDITLSVLAQFGIKVTFADNCYRIPGGQSYTAADYSVESDFSQAAFFLTANCLGSCISLDSFQENSVQGDSFVMTLLKQIGGAPSWNAGRITMESVNDTLKGFKINASDIPDLVPILCVLASFCDGVSTISHIERLKIKESDRIATTMELINRMGGKITCENDVLTIEPVETFHSAEIDSCNDHRIAMAAAIATLKADGPVKILDAGCVKKSYPTFFEDYRKLGGNCHVIHVD